MNMKIGIFGLTAILTLATTYIAATPTTDEEKMLCNLRFKIGNNSLILNKYPTPWNATTLIKSSYPYKDESKQNAMINFDGNEEVVKLAKQYTEAFEKAYTYVGQLGDSEAEKALKLLFGIK